MLFARAVDDIGPAPGPSYQPPVYEKDPQTMMFMQQPQTMTPLLPQSPLVPQAPMPQVPVPSGPEPCPPGTIEKWTMDGQRICDQIMTGPSPQPDTGYQTTITDTDAVVANDSAVAAVIEAMAQMICELRKQGLSDEAITEQLAARFQAPFPGAYPQAFQIANQRCAIAKRNTMILVGLGVLAAGALGYAAYRYFNK